jgi:hypothetical protein
MMNAGAAQTGERREASMTKKTPEIPEHVVTALKGVVEWAHSFSPDDDRLLVDDIPAIAAWLEQLGVLPPDWREQFVLPEE